MSVSQQHYVVLTGSDFPDYNSAHAINAQPGISFERSIAGRIPPGAHVVLNAHGSPRGGFQWNNREFVSYDRLFSALPETTQAVTLTSCYGQSGLVEDLLKHAPAGMIVQSLIGESSVGVIPSITQTEWEVDNGIASTRPVDLFIEGLDNFIPAEYERQVSDINKRLGTSYRISAEAAMPHIIGIGGNPPQLIDLNHTVTQLARSGNRLTRSDSWKSAVDHVQARFDTEYPRMSARDTTVAVSQGNRAQERSLDASIEQVAQKIERGGHPANVEEKRIAYALAAAWLDESGQLDRMQEQARTAAGQARAAPPHETRPGRQATAEPSAPSRSAPLSIHERTLQELAQTPQTLSRLDGKAGGRPNRNVEIEEVTKALQERGIRLSEADTDKDRTLSFPEIATGLGLRIVPRR